jgi:hypothetical protein
MKELAAETDGTRFAQALHLLFDLDPEAISQLTASTDVKFEPSGNPSGAAAQPISGAATYDELLGGVS